LGISWLHYHEIDGNVKSAMDLAACNGHLEILQWLHQNRIGGCTVDAMGCASRHGQLKVVECLCEILHL
jgi:hypothetical protein